MEKIEQLYSQIAANLEDQGLSSGLKPEEITGLPDYLQQLHHFKLFGSDLLAIPAEQIRPGEDEEYELPFSFLSSQEGFVTFEGEYRSVIPTEFLPFGYLHGASEIVLLNRLKETVHVFHVADIVDQRSMTYSLQNPICSYAMFISNIKNQTVACLNNPANYAEALLLEIRQGNRIYLDYELLKPSENVQQDFIAICKTHLEKGMEIHYAPHKVSAYLAK